MHGHSNVKSSISYFIPKQTSNQNFTGVFISCMEIVFFFDKTLRWLVISYKFSDDFFLRIRSLRIQSPPKRRYLIIRRHGVISHNKLIYIKRCGNFKPLISTAFRNLDPEAYIMNLLEVWSIEDNSRCTQHAKRGYGTKKEVQF